MLDNLSPLLVAFYTYNYDYNYYEAAYVINVTTKCLERYLN